MKRFGTKCEVRTARFSNVGGLIAIAVPVMLIVASAAGPWAQSQTQSSPANPLKYEFDVASIKPSQSGGSRPIRAGFTPGGYAANNITIRRLMNAAYGVENFLIYGGPNWLGSERYDVDARMDDSVAEVLQKLGPDARKLAQQQMLQALLTDRFKLMAHRETKVLDVYTLVVAKNGPKFHEAKQDDTYANGFKGRDGLPIGGGRAGVGPNGKLIYQGVPISSLARFLTGIADAPVIDKTGLTGIYDFSFQWPPEQSDPIDPSGADFFAAVQDQLGLKLVPGKGPVEVIVIDHVERASAN